MKTVKALLMVMLLTAALYAQSKDYSKEPGYIDFGEFTELEESELVTEVMIEDNLLNMVAKIAGNEDKALADLLGGLKLIRVHEFQVDPSRVANYKQRFEDINTRLNKNGWDRIVMSRQKNEYANVYIRTADDGNINGLVVTNYDFGDTTGGDVVFVNIVGHINLESIGKLSGQFDIPHLDKVHKNNNHKGED